MKSEVVGTPKNIWLEMSSPKAALCSSCPQILPEFVCTNCKAPFCATCITDRHAEPLHRIQTYTGHLVTPHQLGVRLRLGHNGQCPQAVLQQDFTIITVQGVVKIDVEYCGCVGAPSRYDQMMGVGLVAMSTANPSAAADFVVMFSLLADIATTCIKMDVLHLSPKLKRKKKWSLKPLPPPPQAAPVPIPPRVWPRKRPSKESLKEVAAYFQDPDHEAQWQADVATLVRNLASGGDNIPWDDYNIGSSKPTPEDEIGKPLSRKAACLREYYAWLAEWTPDKWTVKKAEATLNLPMQEMIGAEWEDYSGFEYVL
ncbi:hypothetical protein DFH07DRAFT_957805 [Mycena maculata]|uniref:B box-type domain-containing protein n=1 Tax=Mycena maculata TaxID=230809 RepID=A0AAD7JD75_9AGAR|nr:hypothetical protein DFH07DRAFT_957805 [Mycena maculata]